MSLRPSPQRGFSLLEISVVLTILAVLITMVGSGRDLMFSARAASTTTGFVQDWRAAFIDFRRRTNQYPGDDPDHPTGLILGGLNSALCNAGAGLNAALSNSLLAAGVSLPEKVPRPQRPDILLYADAEGIGHEGQLCLISVNKSVPGTSAGTHVHVPRAALQLRQVHFSLAQSIDSLMDGSLSTRYGSVRTLAQAGNLADVAPGADCWGGVAQGCSGAAGSGVVVDLLIFLE